jgi:hypothetical protein
MRSEFAVVIIGLAALAPFGAACSAPAGEAPRRARAVRPAPVVRIVPKKKYRPPGFKSLDQSPLGPVLGVSYVNDPDVKTLADLARLYRVPATFRYAVTAWGQPVLRRVVDGALFSITAEEGMLTIDVKWLSNGKPAYDTAEIMRFDKEPTCQKEYGLGPGICISGFGRSRDGRSQYEPAAPKKRPGS